MKCNTIGSRLRVPIINMVTISKFIEHAVVLSPVKESSLTRAKSCGLIRRINIFCISHLQYGVAPLKVKELNGQIRRVAFVLLNRVVELTIKTLKQVRLLQEIYF